MELLGEKMDALTELVKTFVNAKQREKVLSYAAAASAPVVHATPASAAATAAAATTTRDVAIL